MLHCLHPCLLGCCLPLPTFVDAQLQLLVQCSQSVGYSNRKTLVFKKYVKLLLLKVLKLIILFFIYSLHKLWYYGALHAVSATNQESVPAHNSCKTPFCCFQFLLVCVLNSNQMCWSLEVFIKRCCF